MIKRGHSVFRFRPMSAQLRRYIHRAVEGNEFVCTASEGEGKWRKVTLRPTEKALEAARANTAPADFVPGVIGEDIPEETPAQKAVAEAEQEKALNEYHESCSCCAGEPAAETPAQPETNPAASEAVVVQETVTVTVETAPAAAPAEEAAPTAQTAQPEAAAEQPAPAEQPACNCGPLFEAPQDNQPENK